MNENGNQIGNMGRRVKQKMSNEQRKVVIECLVGFVKRVSGGEKEVSPAEIAVLPEIARLLFEKNILGAS